METAGLPNQRKLLVLDLDSTLIWADFAHISGYDFNFTLKGQTIWVKKRPRLDDFLIEARKYYDVGVWSAAPKAYVTYIVEKLIPDAVFVMSGERCTDHAYFCPMGEKYRHVIKKLSKIWDQRGNHYTRRNTVIVDDTPETYMLNYGNSIPIRAYVGGDEDTELVRVWSILNQVLPSGDVRLVNKRWTDYRNSQCSKGSGDNTS